MGLSFLDHAVDFVLRQGGAAGDGHGLLLAGALVLGGHVHDTVGVDIEGDLDLRNATRSRSDTGQLEGAKRLVVAGEFTLALIHLDKHARLVVLSGGEDLGTLGRDGGVAVDELGHNAALGLDTEAQRGHIDEQDILAVALDDAGLDGCADCDDLIRVDGLVRFLAAGELLDELLDRRHTGGTADEHDMVDVAHGDARVGQHVVERRAATVEQVGGHFLEVCTGERLVEVDRCAVRRHGQVLHGNLRAGGAGQFLLRLLRGFLQPLQGDLVLAQVDAVLVLDFADEPINDLLIPIIAAEMVITVRGLHLDGGEAVVILADFQQGDIEGAAAEVEDQDALVFLALFKAVCQCGCGRLVDDTQHVEAGDLAGVLGGLALGIVEVCRAGDDGVGDGLAELLFGVPLELHQDLCGNLLRSPLLAVDFDRPVSAHMALDGADGAVNIGDSLALGDFADQDFTGLAEGDHRRGGACAFRVLDNGGLAAFQRCDAGVCRTQIDTNCASHMFSFIVVLLSTSLPKWRRPKTAPWMLPKLEPTSLNFEWSTFIPTYHEKFFRPCERATPMPSASQNTHA